jgi:hypothetical protein
MANDQLLRAAAAVSKTTSTRCGPIPELRWAAKSRWPASPVPDPLGALRLYSGRVHTA